MCVLVHNHNITLICFIVVKYVPGWVPGAGFQNKAKYWRKCLNETADTLLKVKASMVSINVHFISSVILDLTD